MRAARKLLGRALTRAGQSLMSGDDARQREAIPVDFDTCSVELWKKVKSRTMTSIERIDALRRAVEHIHVNSIPGDIVECGVWRGGSMMAAALTLKRLSTNRRLWLYDTFSGMTPPHREDVDVTGRAAADLLASEDPNVSNNWANSPIDDARQGLADVGYPTEYTQFIVGPVENTIPKFVPDVIALLRLDTDWFQSTYHELIHLWPKVTEGGILIIDDYGHWAGAKKAVDQYFAEQCLHPFLHRIDYTGRLVVKCRAVPLTELQGNAK